MVYIFVRFRMIGEALSRDEVYVWSRFSILHIGIIGAHSMSKAGKQVLSFRYLHLVGILGGACTDGQRNAMTVQVSDQSICSYVRERERERERESERERRCE